MAEAAGAPQGPSRDWTPTQVTLLPLSRCSLTSEQVRKHYLSGGPEAHESTGIMFVETEVQSGKSVGLP